MERRSMGTAITRRAKGQYPPTQPAPRIIHLPRRPRRRAAKASPLKLPGSQNERKGVILERLFDQERSFTRGSVPVVLVSPRESDDGRRRGRVAVVEEEKRENRGGVAFVKEEKWRFQAEMLRAECNLLRMERKIAIKKMERRRVHMERTLKSAAQILLSERNNICEGKDVNISLLEEQINELVKTLQKRPGEVKKCSNFAKKISDEEICMKEIQEMAETSLSIKTSRQGDDYNRNVENLRMEEECSGHCKAIVQRVVEQIRAETEQWSQMQTMLGLVRDELEELHASRDFWEDRALGSDHQIQSLQSAVKEWRKKALSSEAEANELQAQVSVLRREVERLRQETNRKTRRIRIASPINQEAQCETEKRVLMCRKKEDDPNPKELLLDGPKTRTCTTGLRPIRRSPLREIGNMSTMKKQHQHQQQPGEGILPLFSLHKEEMKRLS